MSHRDIMGDHKKIPLRATLLLPFVALTVVAVGLVGFISFQNGRQVVNDDAQRLRGEITGRIQEHLSTFLMNPHRITALNAQAIHQGLLDPTDPEALTRQFISQVGIFKSVTSVYFGNTRGGLADSGREGATGTRYIMLTDNFTKGPLTKYALDDRGDRREVLFRIPEFDATERPWYLDAVRKGAATWGPVYVLSTGQDMAIAASRPVYNGQGGLLGVVSVDLFLSHLSYFLEHLKIGQTGQAFIIERSGLLIASSTGESPYSGPSGSKPRPRLNVAESRNPLISHSIMAIRDHHLEIKEITKTLHLEFEIEDQRQDLQITPIRDGNGLDWLIGVVIPEVDFLTRIQAGNKVTAYFVIAALFLALGLGFLAVRGITRPIQTLNTAAQSLAKGDRTQAVSDKSRIRELSGLINSFNLMAGKLQQTVADQRSENAERRQTEEALKESEEQYRLLAEGMTDIIWTTDLGFRTTYVSPSIRKVLGFTPEERKRQSLEEMVTPDSLRRILEVYAREMSPVDENDDPDRSLKMEVEYYRQDGTTVWMENVVKRIRNDAGEVIGFHGVARDISERKRAEAALQASEKNLREAQQIAHLGSWSWDLGSGEIRWSAEMYNIYGVPEGTKPETKEFRRYVLAEDLPIVDAAHHGTMKGQIPDRIEYRLKKPGDQVRWVVARARAVDDDSGAMIKLVGTVQDITEVKEAQEERERLESQLRQAHKMEAIGTLAGGIAHDFNNILAAIIGFCELTLVESPVDLTVRRNIEQIHKSALRARDLVRQILSFSRQTDQERTPLHLGPIVNETLKLLRATTPMTMEIREEVKPDLSLVEADPTQIHQLILNLGSNAADAMKENGGTLTVRLENVLVDATLTKKQVELSEGRYVRITIQDTGPGIPPGIRDRIFDPFFTTKEVGSGTGLGLSVAHGIVQSHGGAISVESTQGQGALFSIYLPAAEAAAAQAEADSSDSLLKGSERILFVDDEPLLADLGRLMLSKLGYAPTIESNSLEALETFKTDPEGFDLVISDMAMPKMSGMVLAEKILKIRPNIPFILCTGYSDQIDEAKAKEMGIRRLLNKPLSISRVSQIIREVLVGPGDA